MRKLNDGGYIDDHGQLYVLKPPPYDSFAAPGVDRPNVLTATGYTFEDVPTYGWPLGVVYSNNPLNFASADTARRMAELVRAALGPNYSVTPYIEGVSVGPYRWANKRMLMVVKQNAVSVDLCAGTLASTHARYPDRFAEQVRDMVR